ncbi:MAG: substrate-binding domain-containing protein [Oscillospiraceae bacterium]|nr:substrate-binding domain-containing protein [Oscillospiraceae bacterium]
MKKLLSVLLILVLAFSLVACGNKGGGNDGGNEGGGDKPKEKTKLRFAVIYTALGDFWDMCGQGGYKRIEELKTEYPDYEIELECTAAAERGLDAQIQVVENIIALGYQAMTIAAADAEGLTPVINQAVDAGMFVLTMDTDCPNSKRTAFVGTHNENFGRKLAQFAVDWVEGGPKVILNHGAIAQLGMIQRLKGITDVLNENADKGAELLDYQSGVSGGPDGQALCEQMMLSFPNWNTTMCDSAGGSVVAAVWEENKWFDAATNHQRCSVLSDDVNQVINAVKDGLATCTLVQKQWQWAYYGVDFMFKKIALGQDPGTDFYETSTFYVTLDNVYDDDMYPTRG